MRGGPLATALIGLAAGAILAAAALAVRYSVDPGFALDMDRDASSLVSGLHDVERIGEETYTWTRQSVTMTLDGLDRRSDWTCTIRLKGARPDPSALPEVVITVDGLIATRAQTSNIYQDVPVTLPARPDGSGATLTLTSSTTFVPGPSDRRTLGVIIDQWTCAPAAAGFVRPPPALIRAAATVGAAFGLAFAVLGAGMLATVGAAALLAIAQAVPLGWAFGMFTTYPERAMWIGIWIAGLLVLSTRVAEWTIGRRLSAAARIVLACTAAVLYLKLLALSHPSKLPIDIVFHAHRLQWVLDGRFYFTQPMPSGVRFPYAIGLYVFAAPWSVVTDDYVLLLRIVVTAAEASGALLVYLLVSRIWRDPFAAVAAALLFHLVPRTFNILHNANMTNAFGQSLAFATLAAAILWRLDRGHRLQVAGLTLLTAWALLSHVSTLTLLGTILLALAALYRFRGGPDLRRPAFRIVGALTVAAGLAVVLYYGWFGDAYRSAIRVRSPSVGITGTTSQPGSPAASAPIPPPQAPGPGLPSKVLVAGRLTVAAVGWPLFLLGLSGAVPFRRHGGSDRLSLAVLALALTYGVFVASVVLMPVERSFQRYADEFISRVTLATYPAVVIVAGLGAAWMWRASGISRLAAGCLLLAAGWLGVTNWIDWLR